MTKTTPTTITPKALALELNVDPKRLRTYLRSKHARNADAKGSNWAIDTDTANDARARFAPKES